MIYFLQPTLKLSEGKYLILIYLGQGSPKPGSGFKLTSKNWNFLTVTGKIETGSNSPVKLTLGQTNSLKTLEGPN